MSAEQHVRKWIARISSVGGLRVGILVALRLAARSKTLGVVGWLTVEGVSRAASVAPAGVWHSDLHGISECSSF